MENVTFCERLKELRKAAGLTQGQLSEKMLVHLQTVSRWERGLIEPDISQLGELSSVLGVSLEKLLGLAEGEKIYSGNFDAATFGKSLSKMRAKASESQEILASSLNVSTDTVSRWERGITCPSIEELVLISERYGVTVSFLYFGITDVEEKTSPVVYTTKKRFPFFITTIVSSCLCVVLAVILIISFSSGKVDNSGLPLNTHSVFLDDTTYIVNDGGSFSLPTPKKDGYDFVEWHDEDGNVVIFPQTITEDKTYYAVFAPANYTVNYNLNGGVCSEELQTSFTVDDEIILPTPQKNGADFLGWYLNPDYSGTAVEKLTCDFSDVTLYAYWKYKTYTITYDLQGGVTKNANPTAIDYGESAKLNPAAKLGYEFLGWYDNKEGSGNAYEKLVEVSSNLSLYAVYWAKTYSVGYYLNGGICSEELQTSFTVNDEIILPTPQKNGADFLGWYLNPDYSGTAVEKLTCKFSDVTLYAYWSDKTYTIIYDLQGGTMENANPETVTSDKEVLLNVPYKKGYEFLGWYDDEFYGLEYTSVGGENAKNLVLYARFQKDDSVYVITYDLQGGVTDSENPTAVHRGEAKKLNPAVKPGYDFLGWYDNKDGSGDAYEYLVDISTNLSLYAVYRAKTYTVRYEYDGFYEGQSSNPNVIEYGETVTLLPVYKTGYDFSGWYTSSLCLADEKVSTIDKSNIGTFSTLYAKHDVKTYTITLITDGGSIDGDIAPATKIDGGYVCLRTVEMPTLYLPTLKKDMYVFFGWYLGDTLIEKIQPYMLSDMEIKAKWVLETGTYNLTYVLGSDDAVNDNPTIVSSQKKLVLEEPTLDGYNFIGWYDNESGYGERVTSLPAGNDKDVTLYAIWQKAEVNGNSSLFEFTIVYDKSVTITKYTGASGKDVVLDIPTTIDGLPVTEIDRLDVENKTFKAINIPEGVVKLDYWAFHGVTVLNTVVIPKNVKEIGACCFQNAECEIVFEENSACKTIGSAAFNSSLARTLVIPNSVTSIESLGAYNNFVYYDGRAEDLDASGMDLYITDEAASALVSLCVTENSNVYASENSRKKLESLSDNVTYLRKTEVTFVDNITGETISTEQDYVFELPEMQKEGYVFLGWAINSEGDGDVYPYNLFIPIHLSSIYSAINLNEYDALNSLKTGKITLYAKFIKISDGDGFSESTPKKLSVNCNYKRYLNNYNPNLKEFYFVIDTDKTIDVSISSGMVSEIIDGVEYKIPSGRYIYTPGTILIAKIQKSQMSLRYNLMIQITLYG